MFIASNYLSFNITLFGRFQDGAIPFASEGDRRLPAAKITLYIIFTSIVEKNTLLPFGTSVCTTIKLVFHIPFLPEPFLGLLNLCHCFVFVECILHKYAMLHKFSDRIFQNMMLWKSAFVWSRPRLCYR